MLLIGRKHSGFCRKHWKNARRNKIIFFDELPWFDTYASHFISALEHFWNDWASYRSDIKLIACGSATTWMLNQVINSRGGLHNRITHNILLSPFKLHEVEEYFKAQGFIMSARKSLSAIWQWAV